MTRKGGRQLAMAICLQIGKCQEAEGASDVASLRLRLLTILEGALAERLDSRFLYQIGVAADYSPAAGSALLCQPACFEIAARFVVDSEGNIVEAGQSNEVNACGH